MKKYFLISCAILLFNTASNSQNLKKEYFEAKDQNYGCFVQLMDSSIITYKTLESRLPFFTWGALFGDNKKLKYEPEDIMAYQTDKGYFLKVTDRNNANILFDYCFAERVRKGSIELFIRFSSLGKVTNLQQISYFFKKGQWVSGVGIEGSALKLAVKDKKQVYNSFDDVYNKGRIKDLMAVVDMYNETK